MTTENDAPESGGDDLRSELERAFANPSPEPAATDLIPEADAAPDPYAAPVEEATPEVTETASEAEARARDEKGRFAPKAEAKAPEAAKAPEVKAEQPKPETAEVEPPTYWKGAAKTRWNALPAPVRQEIAAREKQISDMERGFSGVAQVLAPRAQRLAAAYGSPEQALQTLFQLSDFAEKDPSGFVTYFMQQRGIDPRRLFQQPSGQQPPQGAAPNDATGLQAEVMQLRQKLHALEQNTTTASEQALRAQIDAFARDPSRPYFNDVREDMAALLQSERVDSLEEAYERAIWANPDVRQTILAEQSEKAERERKAKADTARKAQQANLNGSAPVGLTADATPDSIRGSLVQEWNRQMGRVS